MQIREDILTPKERVMALLTGKPLDRILCMPIVTSNSVHLIGKTTKEFQLDGKVMAASHIAAFEKYRYDLIYLLTVLMWLKQWVPSWYTLRMNLLTARFLLFSPKKI